MVMGILCNHYSKYSLDSMQEGALNVDGGALKRDKNPLPSAAPDGMGKIEIISRNSELTYETVLLNKRNPVLYKRYSLLTKRNTVLT